jgi:hypothetical protein
MSSDVIDKIAAPNGGSCAAAATSDRYTARLAFQSMSVLIAEYEFLLNQSA